MTLYVHLKYGNIGIQFYFYDIIKIRHHMVSLVVNGFLFYMPNWFII